MTHGGLLTIEADVEPERTRTRVRAARSLFGPQLRAMRLAGPPGSVAAARAHLADEAPPPVGVASVAWQGYLPAGCMPVAVDLARLLRERSAVIPWPIATALPPESCREPTEPIEGWIATSPIAEDAAALPLPALIARHEAAGDARDWLSAELPAPHPASDDRFPDGRLTMGSSVAAIVPHRHCERWLAEALRSLTRQTRPLDAVIVVDDGSGSPPRDICAAFPEVALYETPLSVGPYRIAQSVIEASWYDAYLFQDADDFSTVDRLERLLAGAAASGAELIGAQEIRVVDDDGYWPSTYPIDVNHASRRGPQHPLLHPTSLVARSLVARLGGFPTGLRFSGDTEFLYRAVFAARIVNVPGFSYVHRIRPGSLTTSATTGMQSPARLAVLAAVREHAALNLRRIDAGMTPDLAPIAVSAPVPLRHVAGPPVLRGAS